MFHTSCLAPWLTKASATCPLCRAEVATPSPEAIAAAAVETANGRRRASVDEANTGDGAMGTGVNKEDGDRERDGSKRWINYCPRSNFVFSNTTNQSSVMRGDAPEPVTDDASTRGEDGNDEETEARDEVKRTIQTQLKKRFSRVSSEKSKAEADQTHSLDAFARLRAELKAARKEREDDAKADGMSVDERIALAQKLAAGDGEGAAEPTE